MGTYRLYLTVFVCICSLYLFADTKTFVREYYYQASETDSKVTAREKSLTEVKRLLLEELGVYMESYVNYTTESAGQTVSKEFIHNEIKQLSAGITETKILEELWTGGQYYVKAEIAADPSEVIRTINKTLEKRKADVLIDSLQILLSNTKQSIELKNGEIERLSSELISQKAANDAQEEKLFALNNQLNALQKQMEGYQKEAQIISNEIDRIIANMENMTEKASSNARYLMTKEEVKRVCGEPRVKSFGFHGEAQWNYGYVWLYFSSSGLLLGVYRTEDCFESGYPKNEAYNYIIK